MPFRSFRRRSFRGRRRSHRFVWVRDDVQVLSATTPVSVDLLADFRNHMNWSVMFPEITIWRLIIKIGIVGTISVAGTPKAGDGMVITSYVEDQNITPLVTANFPYAYSYMIYDHVYSAQSFTENYSNINISTTTGQALYREYDVKSHRRFLAIDDTLWLGMSTVGDFVIGSYAYNLRALLRLPM